MSEIQGQKSNKISHPDPVKDEYPSFIIEIAGEPFLLVHSVSEFCPSTHGCFFSFS